MRKLCIVTALAGLAAAPAAAMTLDEVVNRHIKARGGRAAWEQVESMKITGSFTAFSEVAPFTLVKASGSRYHLDHLQNGKKVVVGHDGTTAWWDNAWFSPGAQPMSGPDLAALVNDLSLATPLFSYKELGYEAEYLGEISLEGIPALGVRLTRPDEGQETWYLDPGTFLELGREAPGSDFGRAMQQRTFYDDFRTVKGVTVPFLVETQWYTRDRVMHVENVEINVPVEPALFSMPAPPGMGPLQALVGNWKVAASQRQQPGADWQDSETTSSISRKLGGALLEEAFTTAAGAGVIRTLSYDKFNEVYRLTGINDRQTQLDVREGSLGEDGSLTLSNTETGTSWSGFGRTFHGRTRLFEMGENSFKMEQEVSVDGGENWFVAGKATYTRSDS